MELSTCEILKSYKKPILSENEFNEYATMLKKKKKDDQPIGWNTGVPILDLKKSDLTIEEQQFFIIALGLMTIIML